MNYLDLILVIPLVWAVYKGFTKGLIYSVATLLALFLGIFGAIHFSFYAEGFLQEWFNPNPRYLNLIAFAVTFILIVIAVHLTAFFLDKIVKAVALGIVNRLAGVLFNLLKMAFILSVILSILNYINSFGNFIPDEDREESLLYDPISSFAPAVFPYFKYDDFKDKYKEWEEDTEDAPVGRAV